MQPSARDLVLSTTPSSAIDDRKAMVGGVAIRHWMTNSVLTQGFDCACSAHVAKPDVECHRLLTEYKRSARADMALCEGTVQISCSAKTVESTLTSGICVRRYEVSCCYDSQALFTLSHNTVYTTSTYCTPHTYVVGVTSRCRSNIITRPPAHHPRGLCSFRAHRLMFCAVK